MSSNTNLGNTPVNQGYVQLIHTGETGGIDGTLRTLYDGDGTASDLQIASNKVKVSTELYIGSKTATEFIQDIVGDMFTTGSYTNITTTYDDTNGNIDLSASGEVTLTGTQTLSNKTLASPTFTGTANGANLTLTGDLTVSGDTIFTNSNTVLIGDAILTLNADETGSPTANAGFEVERGTSANKTFIWNETDDKWTIGSETFVASTFEGNLTGNVTGSASLNLLISNNLSDLANVATARTNLGVDPAGTDNSTNVTLAGSLDYITLSGQQITRNAINLTTDVTGTLPVANGGTGLTSISTLLNSNVTPSSLGLVIGTDVQAQDTLLQDIADFSLSNPSQDGYLIAYSDTEPQLELVAPGISFNGSTANGLLTYGNSTTADVESNLTFDGDFKVTGTGGSTFETVSFDGSNGYLLLSGTASQRMEFRNTTTNANGWIGIPSWNTDAFYAYLPTASGNELGYIYESSRHNLYNDVALQATKKLYLDGGSGTYVHELSDNVIEFRTDNNPQLKIDNSAGVIVNDGSYSSFDFRVESNNNTHMLFVDSGNDRVGIGTSSPGNKLEVRGDIAVAISDTQDIIKLSDAGNDGSIELYTGEATPVLRTKLTAYGDSYFGNSNAQLGIGTSSPAYKLHLEQAGGVMQQLKATDSNQAYMKFVNSATGDGQFTDGFLFGLDSDESVAIWNYEGTAMRFATAGNEQMRIDSSGNVGIGTTSPGYKLDVQGNSRFTSDLRNEGRLLNSVGSSASPSYSFYSQGNAGMYRSGDGVGFSAAGSSVFDINSTRMYINTNVGIGTSSLDAGAKLNVVSGSSAYTAQFSRHDADDGLFLHSEAAGTHYNWLISTQDNVDAGFEITPSTAVGNRSFTTPAFVIKADTGNVGIGTNSPSAKLDVVGSGNAGIEVTGGSGYVAGYFGTDYDYVAKFESFDASAAIVLEDSNSTGNYNRIGVATHDMFFVTNNSERMRIDSSGNVLIGGTSASGHGFNLEVLNDHAYVKGPDGWNGTGDKAIVALGSAVSNESFGCGYVYGTGLVLSTYKLSGGGDFGSSTQNSLVIADTTGQAKFINDVVAFASSDKRLKENIKPLDNALDKIKKINGVEFDWIDGKDEHGNSVHSNEGHDVGVIAQEIEEVLPEVVHTRDNGYKAVKYEKIVPLLIEAIKEQQQQIEELKNG